MGGSRKDNDKGGTKQALNQMLVEFSEIQGKNANLAVFCATNRPSDLDDALIRRFSCRLHIPLPETGDRLNIMKKCLNGNHEITDEQFHELANVCQGFTSNDVTLAVGAAVAFYYQEVITAKTYMVTQIDNGKNQYEPCSPEVDGSQKMTYKKVKRGELKSRPVSYIDMYYSLKNSKRTVTNADEREMYRYARKFPLLMKKDMKVAQCGTDKSLAEIEIKDGGSIFAPKFTTTKEKFGSLIKKLW